MERLHRGLAVNLGPRLSLPFAKKIEKDYRDENGSKEARQGESLRLRSALRNTRRSAREDKRTQIDTLYQNNFKYNIVLSSRNHVPRLFHLCQGEAVERETLFFPGRNEHRGRQKSRLKKTVT